MKIGGKGSLILKDKGMSVTFFILCLQIVSYEKNYKANFMSVSTPSKQVTTPTPERTACSGNHLTVKVATGTDNIAPRVSGAASIRSMCLWMRI